MRLADIPKKIKQTMVFDGDLPKDVFLILLILLATLGGFLIGRITEKMDQESGKGSLQVISSSQATALRAQDSAFVESAAENTSDGIKEEDEGVRTYVASKNGKAFYLPTCSGVNRIREENKIWFSSKEEAIGMGYKPAANCKGI